MKQVFNKFNFRNLFSYPQTQGAEDAPNENILTSSEVWGSGPISRLPYFRYTLIVAIKEGSDEADIF